MENNVTHQQLADGARPLTVEWMDTDRVDVTVVVPCYNTERYLDQALCSIEQNGLCRLEILVLNDGSTDGSLRVMQAHAARDSRVRVIDKPNQGYGATVNRGIREARGIYVAIFEPDDYALPHMYDELVELAHAFGMPDVVKSCYWRVITQGSSREWRAYGYLHGRVRTQGECFTLADEPELIQYHPSLWSALYNRAFLQREGIRFIEVPGAGWVDNPFTTEALAAAQSIVYTDKAHYCYREDLASASSANVPAQIMIDRWNDRQDALDRRGVTNKGILRSNAIVGLRFLARMLDSGELDDADLHCDAKAMAARLAPYVDATIDCISPQVVERVLDLAGCATKGNTLSCTSAAYYTHLVRETAWALRNNGVRFLAHNLLLAHRKNNN